MSNWTEAQNLNEESVVKPVTESPAVEPVEPVAKVSSPAVKPIDASPVVKPASGAASPALKAQSGTATPNHEHSEHHHHHFHLPKIHSPFSSPTLKPVVDAFDHVLAHLAPEVHDADGNSTHKKTSYTGIGRVH